MKGLTDNQKRTLTAVVNLTKKRGGIPPTFAEIATVTGVSKNTAHFHCKALAKRGLLTWIDGAPRTMRVLKGAGGTR